MAPFYVWGSTVSRIQSHFEEAVHFLPLSPQSTWHPFHQPQKNEG